MLLVTKKKLVGLVSLLFLFFFCFCKKSDSTLVPNLPPSINPIDTTKTEVNKECKNLSFDYKKQQGCDGQIYPDPQSSKYILPFEKGKTVKMGLCNCSSSYHAAGRGDQYAFDFNMKEGTPLHAARGGVVHTVIENQSSNGGGSGNWLVINHGDNTFGIYLHSPKNGIYVEKGDTIKQGQVVGEVGRSGLAGYPHLHFIVVKDNPVWPYKGIPISFKNVFPPDVILKTNGEYTACGN
ncbi:MAG TPA: M23 family metallopeptidase [Bacteroidetes bacterium]|nr:M23 family metallopeptidase [Bacteroidota bacterium]